MKESKFFLFIGMVLFSLLSWGQTKPLVISTNNTPLDRKALELISQEAFRRLGVGFKIVINPSERSLNVQDKCHGGENCPQGGQAGAAVQNAGCRACRSGTLLSMTSYRDGIALIHNMGLSSIAPLGPTLKDVDMYLYLNKRHEDLAPKLANVLRDMKADGTYNKIMFSTPG